MRNKNEKTKQGLAVWMVRAIRGERKESISTTTKGFQHLSTPRRLVWMKLQLNVLIYKECSLVRSSYSYGQISSTAPWLGPYLETNMWKPTFSSFIPSCGKHAKKETRGSKLCGIIFSLGLLCWFVFPGDTPSHTIPGRIPFHSRGHWFHFTA